MFLDVMPHVSFGFFLFFENLRMIVLYRIFLLSELSEFKREKWFLKYTLRTTLSIET